MIVSDKQVLQLFLIAKDSLVYLSGMGISQADRQVLVDEIANQQSDKLVDLEEDEK